MLKRLPEPLSSRQVVSAGGVDITAQFNTLRKRWKTIALSMVLAVLASIVVLFVVTPRYTATTQILFDPRKQNLLALQSAMQGVAIDAGSVESEVALFQSYHVLDRVSRKLQLDKVAEFSRQSNLLSLLIGTGDKADATLADGKSTPEQVLAVRRLKERTSARRVGLTYVMEISATSTDRVLATKLADELAQSYLIEQLEARYDVTRRATAWYGERLVVLREQLQESERKVADYRAQHGLVETQHGAIDKQQVSELSAQLVLARAQTAEKRAKFEQAERVSRASGANAAVAEVLQSTLISNLRTQEAEVARREADLSAKYAAGHPLVVNVRAERADLRRAIAAEVQRVISNFRNEYEVAQKREESLEQSLAQFTNVATANDSVKIKLRELERDVESNRALYESFLANSKSAREQTTLEASESRVITPAIIPNAPSFPRKPLFLGFALVFGFAAGVGLAFLLDYIENGFMTAEQAESVLELPVLSVLPAVPESDRAQAGKSLSIPEFVERKPLARFSESVRSVRVGASLSDVDNPPRLLQVTSSVPGEGKSTIAASLAMSAAASGQRVLLIDADLRHPSTSKMFGAEQKSGLVELLSGALPSSSVLLQINQTLVVLPAGSNTKNAPDLLGSQKMSAFISAARDAYDLVIVDTPPVTAVVDSQVVANLTDKIVFVIEWERTPREVVLRSLNLLGDLRHKIAGVVLNKANVKQMKYYSSYYSYYSSAYKNYYQS